MPTLAASIDLTQKVIQLAGDVSYATPPRLYSIDDEVILLERFGEVPANVGETRPIGTDRSIWVIQRGALSSQPAAHAQGASIYAVTLGFSRAATLAPPSPINGTSGSGPHTHPEGEVTALVTDLAAKAPAHAHPYAGTSHAHAESEVTNLAGDLATKAASAHNHDASYAPTHSHPYAGSVHAHSETDVTSLQSDLAGKAASGHNHDVAYAPVHAHPYAGTSHAHLDADIPAAIARDAEVAAAYSPLGHTHAGATIPAGLIVMWGGLVSNIPAGWLLCNGTNGTPDLRDRFIKGATAEAGATGGAASHGHTTTQPADHAALTHAGATVGAHVFTQPGAHTDHAAQAHSAHSGATVANHADVLNHVHLEQLQGGTTGTTTGTFLMGSAALGGSLRSASQSTLNPTTGGVAAQAHTVGQAAAHSDHPVLSHSAHAGGAVDAHTVGQASQHAAQSHSGAAVNTVNSEPAYFALCFIQKA